MLQRLAVDCHLYCIVLVCFYVQGDDSKMHHLKFLQRKCQVSRNYVAILRNFGNRKYTFYQNAHERNGGVIGGLITIRSRALIICPTFRRNRKKFQLTKKNIEHYCLMEILTMARCHPPTTW